MAFSKQVRQFGNLALALVITAIGVVALVSSNSIPGRIFDAFVIVVGLIGIYVSVRDARRKRS